MQKKFKHIRLISWALKIALDLAVLVIASLLSVYIVREGGLWGHESRIFVWTVLHAIIAAAAFLAFGFYRIAYRTFGVVDMVRLGLSFVFIFALECVIALTDSFVDFFHGFLFTVFFFCGVCALRLAFRLRIALSRHYLHMNAKERAVIVGAGYAGTAIIRELQGTNKVAIVPVAAVDDDPMKQNLTLSGVKVVGTVNDVVDVVKKYNATRIFVTMPSASPKVISEVLKKCQKAGVPVQKLPGLYQLAAGTVSVSKMRDVEVADLLGREQIKVNLDEIMDYLEDEIVLVTGGGGSIGSELCRQIATKRPRQLIIFDIYENNAYDIEQELKRKYPALNLLALIGSVRDEGKIESVFAKYKPTIVFNAAAHKHVPLMETSPCEAVKNNVFGTLNVARAADRHGVLRFVQISTDKAVNPTNVMGATKRICEMIIQTIGRHSSTNFVAVRFGNVLGSNGSVIPLFKRQIAEGGPITVTHKDIIRYFMTIPEAVSLVLQAGAYAKGGEIYVLDMGEQVRIYDLAENLIRLSGYEPFVDIDIVCTGLRPGEKLYEERLMDEEGMQKTANESISIGKPLDIDEEAFFAKLDALKAAAYNETEEMKELVHDLVPTYTVDKDGKGVILTK